MNTKEHFITTLASQFRISANWRNAKAKTFSHDSRNAAAAKRLRELETEIVISDDDWEHLAPLVTNPSYLAAVSITNREVSFSKHYSSFGRWLDGLKSNLASV